MISIVIVNWNTGDLLRQCLKSILALPESELALVGKVVVVDNASADTSFEGARGLYGEEERMEFVELRQNVGFARGNNVGVAKLVNGKRSGDDILLLNPDTVVQPGVVVALDAALKRHPKAGVVGPKLMERDGRTVQPSVRRLPTLGVFVLFFLKLQRLLAGSRTWRRYMAVDFEYDTEQPVEQVMGAAFLVRNEVWRKLQGLDEHFWIWFEEVDFCARARRASFEVWYTPAGEIIHYGGVSFGKWQGAAKGFQWLTSCSLYARKHLRWWEYRLLLVLMPVGVLVVGLTAMVSKMKTDQSD